MVYDPTQSNKNKLFNSQPFQLVELTPEDATGPGTKADNTPSTPFEVEGYFTSSRSSPWLLEALSGNSQYTLPVPPTNPNNPSTQPPEPPIEPPANPKPGESAEDQKATTDNKQKAKVFQADVISSENYSHSSSVTTYPVDKSGDVSDHSAYKSFTISISAVHSQTVMSYVDTIGNILNNPLIVGAQNLAEHWGLIDPQQKVLTRVQAAYNMLTEWSRKGTPLMVKCAYARSGFRDEDGEIIPFVIERLNIPRNKNIGKAIRLSFNLRRIKLVELGVTTNTGYEGTDRTKGQGKKRDAVESKKKGKPVKNKVYPECQYFWNGTSYTVAKSIPGNECSPPTLPPPPTS